MTTFVTTGMVLLAGCASALSASLVRAQMPRWQREPAPGCSTSKTEIRFASSSIAETVGLEFVQLQAAPLDHVLERNVELAYNAHRYARLSSRVSGVITEVKKDLGESVQQGEVLVIVDSSELGAAKADLLQAVETSNLWQTNATRERSLAGQGIGTQREALEAETKAAESRIELIKSRQRLRNLGLPAEQVQAVEEQGDTSSLLPVRAPFAGIVVERSAVLGELVDPGRPLLALADMRVVWAMVDLMEADLASVRVGQDATVSLDGLPRKTFTGKLTWISAQLDEKTRTVKARIELENGEGLLRANMFGKAVVRTGSNGKGVAVPKQAVQWEGCCNVAFIKADEAGLVFRAARLTLGHDAGDRYEVLDGLNVGDTVVTTGSFILKNEILKSSIGAGCCEVGHLKK